MPDLPFSITTRVDWTYEEIVIVCAEVVKNGWHALNNVRDERVGTLSDLLRRASPEQAAADPRFRNPNGVKRKSHDIATVRNGYQGAVTKGGKTTLAVVAAFDNEPDRMAELAVAFHLAISDPTSVPTPTDVDDPAAAEEGRVFERRHLARERNPRIRREKIAQSRRYTGSIACEACAFDFEATYGERGRDFVECHHRVPLSVAGPRRTALEDLALLCSNCHRMVHHGQPWLTIDELKALVRTCRDG